MTCLPDIVVYLIGICSFLFGFIMCPYFHGR